MKTPVKTPRYRVYRFKKVSATIESVKKKAACFGGFIAVRFVGKNTSGVAAAVSGLPAGSDPGPFQPAGCHRPLRGPEPAAWQPASPPKGEPAGYQREGRALAPDADLRGRRRRAAGTLLRAMSRGWAINKGNEGGQLRWRVEAKSEGGQRRPAGLGPAIFGWPSARNRARDPAFLSCRMAPVQAPLHS